MLDNGFNDPRIHVCFECAFDVFLCSTFGNHISHEVSTMDQAELKRAGKEGKPQIPAYKERGSDSEEEGREGKGHHQAG